MSKNVHDSLVHYANLVTGRNDLIAHISNLPQTEAYLKDFAQKSELDLERARLIYRELLRFLIIAALHPTQPTTPSKHVGSMWMDICCNGAYRSYTTLVKIIGLYTGMPNEIPVHHYDRALRQYEHTIDTYKSLFDTPPTNIWPENGPDLLEMHIKK